MFKYFIDDLSIDNIKSVIKSYELKEDPYLKKRFDYYNGDQDIYKKEVPEDRPNNKVVTNFCRQIVDTYQGYINLGASSTDSDFVRDNLEVLSDSLRDALISGIAYDLVYYEKTGIALEKKLVKLNPARTVLFRDTTVSHNVIGAATWNRYKVFTEGREKEFVDLYVYDNKTVTTYKGVTIETVEFVEENPHYLNRVPIVEIKTTPNYVSIFDGVMDLQDSYNKIDSSYLDSRETYSNAYLVIKGMAIDDDTASTLIDSNNKIINLPASDASVEYLIKQDAASDIIAMLDNIKRRIFTVTSTPDFNDTQFNQQSGMALKHKLTSFINNINNISREFYATLIAISGVIGEDFDFEFNSYIPSDLEMIVDMVVKLDGIVSRETLLSQLPFVKDVDKELEQAHNILVQKSKSE